jgi:peptide/nickel transport system permease protein
MPNFWLALLLIVGFSVSLGWLPVGGIASIGAGLEGIAWLLDRLTHLILPVIALGAGYVAMYLRSLRAGMVELWAADHVKAARARGLNRPALVWRHVARPALLPVIVLLGQQIGTLFGGSVVVETVFAVPGMGRLAYEAVAGRDMMLMAGIVLGGACLVILINLTVDLVLTLLDPRVGAVYDR